MNKLLFVTYGGGHANIVKEIYKKAKVDFEVDIIALTAAVNIFEREKIPYTKISDYITLFEESSKIQILGAKLAKKHYNKESGLEYNDIVAYLGLSFWNLVMDNGGDENIAMKLFEEKGRVIFNPIFVMGRILEKISPDALIVTCSVRMEKAAAIAANHLGIPVIKINDLPQGGVIPYDCTVCVMNQFAKDYLIEHKIIGEDKIVITGQPVFEANKIVDTETIEQIITQIGSVNYKNIILYLEQNDYNCTRITEQELIKIAKKNKQNLYIFKLHPNQNLKEESNLPLNVMIIRDIEIKYLINICDIAITWYSTSGLEAALIGKPLIVVMLKEVDKDFSKCGIAVKIQDIDKLESHIELCLNKESDIYKKLAVGREKFINPTNSVDKILDVIKKEINS